MPPCLRPSLPWLLLAAALLPARPLAAGPAAGPAGDASPARFGLTVSSNTFQPADRSAGYPVAPGLYARAGLSWLPGSRLELELFQVPRLVPDPFTEAFTGFSAGCWLFRRKHDSYFNLTADLSFMLGLEGRKLLAARLCPIVLGGPYYHYADRLLAVALVWDPEQASLFWQLQLVGLSLYF
jgi:hypothetical protein